MKNSMQKTPKTVQNPSISVGNDFRNFTSDNFCEPYGHKWEITPSTKFEFMHNHNFIELGLLESESSGVFNVDDDVIPVKGPAVSIIYGGQFHSAQSNPDTPCKWRFLYIDEHIAMPNVDKNHLKSLRYSSYYNYTFKSVISKSENELLYSLIKDVIYQCSNIGKSHKKIIEGELLSILTLHSSTMTRISENADKNDEIETFAKIQPAINMINANFGNEIKIPELAKLCFVSESSLRRLFIAFCGLSPDGYLHKVRMNVACARLLSSDTSVIDVATECGYPTLSSFNRQFKKTFGVSPTTWRKERNTEN